MQGGEEGGARGVDGQVWVVGGGDYAGADHVAFSGEQGFFLEGGPAAGGDGGGAGKAGEGEGRGVAFVEGG